MPNIRPSDFSYYLPKEKDTVAQGLLKFIRFSIVFWRWFRSSVNTDGSLSTQFKGGLCNLDRDNCRQGKTVVPGEGGEPGGGSGGGAGGGGGGGGGTGGGGGGAGDCSQVGFSDPACCDTVRHYGIDTPEGLTEANRGKAKAGGSFHYYNPVKLNNITGGVDLFCDNDGRKQVGVLMTHKQSFTSNLEWSKDVAKYSSPMFGTGATSGGDQTEAYFGDYQNENRTGSVQYKSGSWLWVEVLIYGYTDMLIPPKNATKGAKVLGHFTMNPLSPTAAGTPIRFLVENNGEWCVRLWIREWELDAVGNGGWPTRGFRIDFSRALPYEYNPQYVAWDGDPDSKGQLPSSQLYWPLEYTAGTNGNRKHQRYLTKVNGVRITLAGKYVSVAETLKRPLLCGNSPWLGPINGTQDAPNAEGFVVYDERWQNEKPCYTEQAGTTAVETKPRAFTWSEDGRGDSPSSYPMSCVNDLDVTYDSSQDKAMIDASHLKQERRG